LADYLLTYLLLCCYTDNGADFKWLEWFLRATAVPAGSLLLRARISYGNSVRPSVCLSVLVSRPGTESSPGQIETAGFHHMIA